MRKLLLTIHLVGLLAVTAFAQNRLVTGRITTADAGETLTGVTVKIKGTGQAAISDAEGKFRINAKTGDVLVFSFIGYITAETPVVNNVNSYAVKLQTDTRLLNEVVVTDSYGTQLKKGYTGSATTVKGVENENKPFTSTMLSLQGEVAGLNVSSFSGQPGADVQVRLRGVGSIGIGSEPLYVIDGTIINSGDLSTETTTSNVLAGVNNDDIASITVLKDASATAIYGSRGSNGVIVITTKKGKSGKSDVEVSAQSGSTTDIPLPAAGQPLTPAQFRTITLEGLQNAGYDAGTIDYYKQLYSGRSNNWYDLVTRNGTSQQYNGSVNGGDENTKIFASGGYLKQNATTIASSFTRISGLVNIDRTISKKISMSLGLNVSNVNQLTPSNGGAFSNPIGSAFFLTPFQTAYNKNGSININRADYPDGVSNYNPIYIAQNDKNYLSQTRALGNLSLKWDIISTLKFTSYVGLDDNILEERVYNNPIMGDGAPTGAGYDNYTRYFNYDIRNQLDYRYNIAKDNDDFFVDLTAGYEAQKSSSYFLQGSGIDYPLTQHTLTSLSNSSVPTAVVGTFSDYSYDSFYSRGSINYKNIYSLSLSFRRDGSSVFGQNDPYGNFYSVGGAWNIDQEQFFAKQSIFSSAKIRSSFGLTGNSQGLGNYTALPSAGYGNNYAGNVGQNYNNLGNPFLTWESSHKFDAGADIGFLKDRLTFSIDYYRNSIDGLIQAVPLSYTTGFGSVTANAGSMLNRGWEIDITGNPIKLKDFNWTTDFNIALNKNTVTKLAGGQSYDDAGFETAVGKDLQTWYAPIYAGVDPANGNALWYTDGTKTKTTTNYEDAARVEAMQADPKGFGGFTNTFNYKGIILSFEFYYSFGNYVNDGWANYFSDGVYATEINVYQYIYNNRWTRPGQITDVPKFVAGGTNDGNASAFSSRFLYKGDYIRLRNIDIGYDFKDLSFLKSLGVSKLYLYGRGTNLFVKTFDKRLPFDPEVGPTGVSNLEVPQVRTFTIGLNVGF